MKNSITWVGLDDSANKINIAIFYDQEEKVHQQSQVTNDKTGHGRLIKKIKSLPGEVRCVYEAGVNGYHLHRVLKKGGIHCDVAAPSLTPRRPGDRVKNDPRDAKKLASLYRAGELTSILVPEEEQEGLRDLMRGREDALEDLQRVRHRLGRLLMRRGLKYHGGKAWTLGHLRWIKSIHFDDPNVEMVLQEYRLVLEEAMDRLKRFNDKVEEVAKLPAHQKLAGFLMAIKGIKTITAMTIIAESVDLKRYSNAPAFMDAIGLVPSESSSGETIRRGGITKTGNAHLRRVAVESAWHHRHISNTSKSLRKRRADMPPEILEIAKEADKRLHKKYWKMVNRGKSTRTAAVAVARELVGFIWAIGQAA